MVLGSSAVFTDVQAALHCLQCPPPPLLSSHLSPHPTLSIFCPLPSPALANVLKGLAFSMPVGALTWGKLRWCHPIIPLTVPPTTPPPTLNSRGDIEAKTTCLRGKRSPPPKTWGHRETVTCPGRTHGGEDTLAGLGLVAGASLEPALPHSMRSLGQDTFQIYFFFFSFLKTRSLCAQDLIL